MAAKKAAKSAKKKRKKQTCSVCLKTGTGHNSATCPQR